MNSFAIQGTDRHSSRIQCLVVSFFILAFLIGFQPLRAGEVVPFCLTPPTATPTPTRTPSPTPTSTLTWTETPTWTWTETASWTPTATPTPSFTPSFSPTSTDTITSTPTPSPTPTFAPTETSTLTPTVWVFPAWPDDFYFSKPYPNPNDEVQGVHFEYRLPPSVLRLWLTVYTINGDPIFKEMFLGPAPGSYTYVLDWSKVTGRWANGMYFFVWRAQHNGEEKRFIFKVMILH